MKIYLATVTHRHGTSSYAAGSRDKLYAKLAKYCREWWGEVADALPDAMSSPDSTLPAEHLTSDEIVEAYFGVTNERGTEFFDEGEDNTNPCT